MLTLFQVVVVVTTTQPIDQPLSNPHHHHLLPVFACSSSVFHLSPPNFILDAHLLSGCSGNSTWR
jgi:hypothetical protein